MTIKLYWKTSRDTAVIPKQNKEGDAGFDLAAAETALIWPGQTLAVPTGLHTILAQGTELQVRPRSGLSLRTALRIPNSPGTIDAGYRDEIKVLLYHQGSAFPVSEKVLQKLKPLIEEAWQSEASFDPVYQAKCRDILAKYDVPIHDLENSSPSWGPYIIHQGDRIAQAVAAVVPWVEWQELDETNRAEAEAQSVADRGGGFGSSGVKSERQS